MEIIIILTSLMVIISNSPIHSLFYLILVFINIALVLITLDIEFIGIFLIIVYIGAIALLFLFVIMMLNIKLIEIQENLLRFIPIIFLFGFIFYIELLHDWTYISHNSSYSLDNLTQNLRSIGLLLYTTYYIYFIISGFILLLAMFGAIFLTLKIKMKTYKTARLLHNNLWI